MARARKKDTQYLKHLLLIPFIVGLFFSCSETRDVGVLTQRLKDPKPAVRLKAVARLAEIAVADPYAIPPLVAALADSDEGVRGESDAALAKLGSAAVDPLKAALREPEIRLRISAARLLGRMKNPSAVESLVAILGDANMELRTQVAAALGMIGAPAVNSLLAAIKGGDSTIREGAATALGKTKDPHVIEPLLDLLGDKDEKVQSAAIASLVEMGAVAVDPLISRLKKAQTGFDIHNEFRISKVLGKIGDSRAVEPLISSLERWETLRFAFGGQYGDEGDSMINELSVIIVNSLGSIGAPAVPILVANLSKRKGNVRIGIVGALGLTHDETAGEALVKLLANTKEPSNHRATAALALGIIANARCIEALIGAANDKDENVRLSVLRFLGESRHPQAREFLLAEANQGNLQAVAAAHRFFIRRGAAGSETLLIEALNKYPKAGGVSKGKEILLAAFLKSRNRKLEEAAIKWAEKNHRAIDKIACEDCPEWGQDK